MAAQTSTYQFEGNHVTEKIELFIKLVKKLPAVQSARRNGRTNSVVVRLKPHDCMLAQGAEIARLRSIANKYKPGRT